MNFFMDTARKCFSPDNLKKPPSREEIYDALDGVFDAVAKRFEDMQRDLLGQIDKLQHKVDELQQRPAVTDKGVWTHGRIYAPGDGVTKDGSFWICQRQTDTCPGNGADWRIAVKRGRDSRSVKRDEVERIATSVVDKRMHEERQR
jgi:hypothetical protein